MVLVLMNTSVRCSILTMSDDIAHTDAHLLPFKRWFSRLATLLPLVSS